jgi:hypothetical protein
MEHSGLNLMREDMARDDERFDDGACYPHKRKQYVNISELRKEHALPPRTQADDDYDRRVWGIGV